MTKTVGIVGGIGPESTIIYYRLLVESYRDRKRDGSYPSIQINSIDLKKMVDLMSARESTALIDYLAGEVAKLAHSGSDFALLGANSAHVVFDEVARRSPIPLISIVEVTRETVQTLGLKVAGLFGARFTMQGGFYQKVFSAKGITIALPTPEEQAYIHDRYMNELVQGIVLPETRRELLRIADRMKDQQGIQGLILGGTELSLILGDQQQEEFPILDTLRIHVDSILRELLA